MSAAPSNFQGRRYDLIWLSTKLFPEKGSFFVPPIVLLYGQAGSGRSFLAQRLFDLHLQSPNEREPLLTFSGSQPQAGLAMFDYVGQFAKSAKVTISGLQGKVGQIGRDFGKSWAEITSEAKGPVESYNVDGSVRNLPVNVPGAESVPDGLLLARAFARTLEGWVVGLGSDMNLQSQRLRLLFLFDDFDEYPPSLKDWIGEAFFSELTNCVMLPASSFLLTAKESWEVGGLADYWQAHPASFMQRELGPISRTHCIAWLESLGLDPALVDVLLEETEGLPGRISRMLERPELLEIRARSNSVADSWMAPLGARERRWLHAAAMVERLSEETLQVLLGQAEATEAFIWLVESCPVDSVRSALVDGVKYIYLGSGLRERILSLSVAKVPSRHREFLERIELQARVTAKIPSSSARRQLRTLAPMQPFSLKMLEEAFPQDE